MRMCISRQTCAKLYEDIFIFADKTLASLNSCCVLRVWKLCLVLFVVMYVCLYVFTLRCYFVQTND